MAEGEIEGYLLKPMNYTTFRVHSQQRSYRDLPIRLEFGQFIVGNNPVKLAGLHESGDLLRTMPTYSALKISWRMN